MSPAVSEHVYCICSGNGWSNKYKHHNVVIMSYPIAHNKNLIEASL